LKEYFVDKLVVIGLNAVIMAVTEETPRILTVRRTDYALAQDLSGDERLAVAPDSIPFGPFDPSSDRTLELGLRRWVREQTGLELGYVEQLYTFGDRNRDPSEEEGGPRVISIAYLALVREGKPSGTASADWKGWYLFFPWEDWRAGRMGQVGARCENPQGKKGEKRYQFRAGRSALGSGTGTGALRADLRSRSGRRSLA
jgi:hypothetical protein